MSVETFKQILAKLTSKQSVLPLQIAFGIGDIDGNPDLWKILEACRESNIVPNLTTNGMGVTEDVAKHLASLCGAVAVSHYHIDDVCFDAVQRLNSAGLRQVNIHKLLSANTYESCFKLIDQVKSDPRLAKLKAVVFLLLKPKGKRNHYTGIADLNQYRKLVEYAQSKDVSIGMDSCSAPMALRVLDKDAISYIEPCESGKFSLYINVRGEAFPCSFTEGTEGWERGIDVLQAEDFKRDVWLSARLDAWRGRLQASTTGCGECAVKQHCRACPVYDEITICKPTAKVI